MKLSLKIVLLGHYLDVLPVSDLVTLVNTVVCVARCRDTAEGRKLTQRVVKRFAERAHSLSLCRVCGH